MFLRLAIFLLLSVSVLCKLHKLNWAVKVGNQGTTAIKVGDTVQWTWTDAKPHTVSSIGTPSFTSSSLVTGKGFVYSVTFNTAGSYSYDCSVHATMKGVISVS